MKTPFGELNLANFLTMLRILCIPAFIGLLLYYAESGKIGTYNERLRYYAVELFLALFLLDLLDGIIARKWNQITKLGTILDPVADKVLLVSSLITLGMMPDSAFINHMPLWFIIVIISRDMILLVGALIIHTAREQLRVQPRLAGKIATFSCGALIVTILLNLPEIVFVSFLCLAASCILVSGVQYVYDGYVQFIRKPGHAAP
jgi:CDP-diacylglycerol--glycerol-3-phosphate 3-phosphatidyltransferase